MNVRTCVMYGWMFLLVPVVRVAGNDPLAPGRTGALLINGISKDPNERALNNAIVHDLRAYLLNQAGVEPNRLVVLTPGNRSSPDANAPSADNIRKTLAAFASTLRPADRLLLCYTGQANAVAGTLRFNLPGPDITDRDLADWLRPLQTASQLIVLDCPCAAVAAQALTDPSRIVVCAALESQVHATRFGVHFVSALSRGVNDTNHDDRVSVLEAFTAAAREVEQWYQKRQTLPTETPCLEDDGDGIPSKRPWRYETDGADGRRADGLFLPRAERKGGG